MWRSRSGPWPTPSPWRWPPVRTLRTVIAPLPDAARWAAMAHVLDFDDLHTDTTTHISVVTVPAVLAVGGDARAYLAGAGVMARLGAMLGWGHYAAGWHATCSAGAPAAAVAAGLALGLDTAGLATAIALAVPAAGGGQEAFGTHGKSLQVGFAADAGVRAARLARAGATADPRVLDAWLKRVGGTPATDLPAAPAVPGAWPSSSSPAATPCSGPSPPCARCATGFAAKVGPGLAARSPPSA